MLPRVEFRNFETYEDAAAFATACGQVGLIGITTQEPIIAVTLSGDVIREQVITVWHWLTDGHRIPYPE